MKEYKLRECARLRECAKLGLISPFDERLIIAEYETMKRRVLFGGIALLLILVLVVTAVVNIGKELKKQELEHKLTCSKVVVFTDGTAEGELNISTNITESAQAIITVNETGEVVYKSKLIEWLFGVDKDKLSADLEPGRYECTVTLIGWDDDGFEWELATRDMVIVVQQ
ncbi:hypothetical protein SAMN02745136_00495 [Anaerocolumna jejuensis DSM 15929]|uniref:Uncharacterized protein n=1 Tax=Anaerocolumna jejuensis DSM 15929 TaxID=1121322 RepID=A0A1M6KLC7_9FIRM|nr:hypothetical protein [Anaerocolumna jejuensis]SHJ59773.1 hypothetical protein SAMN02745136_00495 [Anaerocolumna jejuensis DSM 15929]